jgi:hypothetical protein
MPGGTASVSLAPQAFCSLAIKLLRDEARATQGVATRNPRNAGAQQEELPP